MRNIIALFISIFLYAPIFGQTEEPDLKIFPLTDGFYVYVTYNNVDGVRFPSNSMYLVTSEGVVLFDTPWDSTQFQPLLDSIRVRHVKDVILSISTHFHADRTAGVEFLKEKGIRTYSSKKTYTLCSERNERRPEYFFTSDTTFSVGGYKFSTYYPGEGHTRDNIVIWFEQDKILYGGCLIKSTENNSIGNIADANLAEWPKTIKNLIRRYHQPDFVIPGHFDWTDNRGITHTLLLLNRNEKNK